jgi:DNA-binding CsgD family transcriptional regulator
MARVDVRDLHGAVRFLASAVGGTREEPFPLSTIEALRTLIGADGACYFELRRSDRAVLSYTTTPEEPDAPGTVAARERFAHQNPISWRRWNPAVGALRFSRMVTRRQRDRLEFYRYYMQPNRIHDSVKVWLSSSSESASCIVLDRSADDFTDREQDLLGILHEHLVEMRELALAGPASRVVTDNPLTVREAQILMWAARGRSDDAIAATFGMAPATVGKHLEHAYEKLGVHSRSEALWRIGSEPE